MEAGTPAKPSVVESFTTTDVVFTIDVLLLPDSVRPFAGIRITMHNDDGTFVGLALCSEHAQELSELLVRATTIANEMDARSSC